MQRYLFLSTKGHIEGSEMLALQEVHCHWKQMEISFELTVWRGMSIGMSTLYKCLLFFSVSLLTYKSIWLYMRKLKKCLMWLHWNITIRNRRIADSIIPFCKSFFYSFFLSLSYLYSSIHFSIHPPMHTFMCITYIYVNTCVCVYYILFMSYIYINIYIDRDWLICLIYLKWYPPCGNSAYFW